MVVAVLTVAARPSVAVVSLHVVVVAFAFSVLATGCNPS